MSKQRKWHHPLTSGTYVSWLGMKNRCLNPKDVAYRYYGGRGIKVCDAWANDYDQFYADMGERPDGMTLDRIDSDKGYFPDNCRWLPANEQQSNQRRTIRVTHDGCTLTLKEWAKKLSLPYYTIRNRLVVHGMSPTKALVSGSLNRGHPK